MNSLRRGLWSFLLIAVVVVGAAFILWALGVFKPKPPSRPPQIPVLPVSVVEANLQSFQVHLPSQGLVEATTRANIAAQVSGNVVSLSSDFDAGGVFKRGDVLMTIDDADFIAAVKLAESNLIQAEVNLQQEIVRAEQAERDWLRLGNGKEASSLVKREPQLAAARGQVIAAKAQLERSELDLARTKIVAPFDGRVINQSVDVGSYVSRGQTVGQVVEVDQLQINLPVSASWRRFLDWSGKESLVTLSLNVDGRVAHWTGEITSTSADVSQGSRQFSIVARIDVDSASDPQTVLFIGDYVSASITGRVLEDVYIVPRQAVKNDQYVWLVVNDRLQKQNVNVRWVDEGLVVIDQGLQQGDLVVLTPVGSAITGSPVRVVAPVDPVLPEVSARVQND